MNEGLLNGKKLNILVLPSQTTIMAVMIIISIHGTFFMFAINIRYFIFWPIFIALIFISFKSVLDWPNRSIKKYKLVNASEKHRFLQERVDCICGKIGLKNIPVVMISQKDIGPEVIGAFRRRIIAMGEEKADKLQEISKDVEGIEIIDAILLHELSHFHLGDNLLIGYTKSLLSDSIKMTIWLSFLGILLASITIMLMLDMVNNYNREYVLDLYKVSPFPIDWDIIFKMFMSFNEFEVFKRLIQEQELLLLFVLVTVSTFYISSIIFLFPALLWFKLMRVRELYADVATIRYQNTIRSISMAIFEIGFKTSKIDLESVINREKREFQQNNRLSALMGIFLSSRVIVLIAAVWARLFSNHYDSAKRIRIFRMPHESYDNSDKLALLVGFFGIYFELLFMNMPTGLVRYVSSMNMIVSILFLFLGLGMPIYVLMGEMLFRHVIRFVFVALMPYMLFYLISVVSVWSIALTNSESLPIFMSVGIKYHLGVIDGFSQEYIDFEDILLLSVQNIVQILAMFFILMIAIEIMRRFLCEIMTWYAYISSGDRLKRVVYIAVILMTFVLSFIIIPLASNIVLFEFESVISIWNVIRMMILIALIIYSIWWFKKMKNIYSRCCLFCKNIVPGEFVLGKTCSNCQNLLHTWLLVDYNTDPVRYSYRKRLR